MKRATSFQKTLLIDIVVAIGILLPLFVGITLLQSYIKHTATQIVTARQELAKRTASLNTLVTLRNDYKTYGSRYFNVLYNIIPEKDELINVSQELQSLATKEELGFGFSFRGEEPSGDATLGFVQFSINVVGENLDQITNFVERLKDFRYLTTIDNLHISSKDKKIQAIMEGKVQFR